MRPGTGFVTWATTKLSERGPRVAAGSWPGYAVAPVDRTLSQMLDTYSWKTTTGALVVQFAPVRYWASIGQHAAPPISS